MDLVPKETDFQRINRLFVLAGKSFLIDVGVFRAVYVVVLAETVWTLTVGLNAIGTVQSSDILTMGEKTILVVLIVLFIVVLLKYIMDFLDSLIRWITRGVFRNG